MVLDYHKLREQPFGVTPDPRYLYLSRTHREALASLSYGIRSGRGFMSIQAKPGMGKTTILFQLLRQLKGSARTVFLFQTLCRPEDLLRSLLRDLGVADDGGDIARMQEQLNYLLLAEARQGRKVVVVIDEAQNLEDSALELVRMLSNFETTSDKLMQIILAGQPQLREKLASPRLLQLRQRMSIFARLHPLTVEETRFYIEHRLRVAGYDFKTPLFSPRAGALVAKYSEGIPRNINNICFNALSLGCVMKQKTIQEEVVRESLEDLDFDVGGANDSREGPAQSKWLALGASKPTAVPQRLFSWRRRLAACVMLAMPLVWSSGGQQSPEVLGSGSLLAVSATSQIGTEQVTSAVPEDYRNSPGQAINGERQPRTRSVAEISVDGTSGRPEAVLSTMTQKSRQHPRQGLQQTDDLPLLWAQVKNQSSDAEIKLARIYLEGTAVPQNCAQAQILLQAASRKENNLAAVGLLSDYAGRCR
jgi:type II secretory pathway predicted ATPase ExeA